MDIVISLIIIGIIIGLWILAGKYEWKVPARISENMPKAIPRKQENCIIETVELDIEAREFIHEDMEKEIYIIRKSRKKLTPVQMNVRIEAAEGLWIETEREKTKRILEKRFPGLTVNYTLKEQEEKDAFSYAD